MLLRKENSAWIRVLISILIAAAVLLICIFFGSVHISLPEGMHIVAFKLFGKPLPPGIADNKVSILWNIRIPRVFTAFLVGGALSVSGVIMQAVLRNPLASSYTLGVSSGASLGVAIVMVSGISISWLGSFLMPAAGFIFGAITVALAIGAASAAGSDLRNQTIILVGMVLSLFLNAIITLIGSFFPEYTARLAIWQMGSFGGRGWKHVLIMLIVLAVSWIFVSFFTREMDILTFGDEQGTAIGVDTGKVSRVLLFVSSLLTGVAVCFSGIIGFIDLIAPHVVRKVFGASHKTVVPMSVIYGGCFMAVCDFISRTLLSPREISVGAVTAILGAPFFAYIYFRRNKD